MVVDGHLDDAGYVDVLQRADIVVSTALQEFFGISIVEAIYAGAFPVLPDGLVYRERIPEQLREGCLYRGPNHLVALLEAAVGDASRRRQVAGALSAEVASFDWSVVTPRYDEWVGSITTS